MENATGVCEKNGHPIITNSMRVGPFPLKEYIPQALQGSRLERRSCVACAQMDGI